ncbi:TonB-dependent receptor [Dyella sp. ASV21]|uniref:TonB-dependent receptor plug domain-containing protein n=1 Tax=Dyella sp. ASV21 TaxID=2795114 RepID=UPI0018EDE37A|nr:TonB-dependent receptor [Dyella sp. ASV21]
MKFGENKLCTSVRLALSLGMLAASAYGTAAFAQDAQSNANAQQDQNQKAKTLETITVTGSHIRRVDVETSNPVVTIDAAAIKATGKLTLGDILQQLPAVTGGNVNPQVNNGGGTGGSSIGLRGLGAQRTLVLIDGKRIINNDVNAIPADMIERVEVLTDGASSVYGSDAIGGVVNFILKKSYQGATFALNYGESDHNDGASQGYTFTFGQTSDKGSLMVGLDYNKTDAVQASQRKFSKNAISISGSSQSPIHSYIGGSSYPAYGRIQLPASLAAQYGCSNVALNKGASGTNASTDYHCFTNADKYNYATVNLIQTPQERSSFFVNGTYNLADHLQVYVDGYHNKTSSNFQLAPALFGSAYGADIPADNPYNVFGQTYSGSGSDFRLRLVSIGPRITDSTTTTDQIATGFKGDFTVFGQNWNWDAGFDYGHLSTTTITRNLPNVDKINQALTCGTAANPVSSGCTPINIFNQYDPTTASFLQSSAVPGISNAFSIQKIYAVEANGGLFDLPAGTVSAGVGASYRREYTSSTIDPLLTIDPATGNCTLGSQCSSPLSGSYNVKEVYAELFVPVLKDIPFIQSLNVTLGDRYSKFSTFGSTNNTKIGLEWKPIDDLLLRGTMADVFRAPAIGDVFGSPVSDAPKLSSDPCDHATVANPACAGVPLNGTFVNQDVALGQQIKAVTSGSQYAGFPLGPEKGKSFDVGLVYSPSYVPGLSTSVDVWHIYLNDTISAIGAQTVLNLCYAGITAYCPLITRYGAGSANPGQIAQILEPTGNLGSTDTAGIDFSARYKLPQFSFGQFMIGLDATYLKRYDQNTAPGTAANVTFHDAGHFAPYGSAAAATCPSGGGVCLFPRWKGSGFVNWTAGNWDASWRMRYIGRFRNGSSDPTNDTFPAGAGLNGVIFNYGATVYNDASVGYNIAPFNTRVDFGINNLFDKQPPLLYANNVLNANTDPTDFDLQGRYFWARVTVKF